RRPARRLAHGARRHAARVRGRRHQRSPRRRGRLRSDARGPAGGGTSSTSTIVERGRGLTMNKTFSYTHCNVGVATRDVTPPVGIYARSWGAATHDTAEGVHRPFAATAAVFAPLEGDGPTLAPVAVDLGWFQHVPDEQKLRATLLERTGLDDA